MAFVAAVVAAAIAAVVAVAFVAVAAAGGQETSAGAVGAD